MNDLSEPQMGELPDEPTDPYGGRYCVNCKHQTMGLRASHFAGTFTTCGFVACELTGDVSFDPIYGKRKSLVDSEQARSETGACGPEGKLWEPK